VVGGFVMEYQILIKANLKQHKGGFIGIFILILLISSALSMVLSVWRNSEYYIKSEMERTGFGEITAWVSEVSDEKELIGEIEALNEVERAEIQSLIFSNYRIKEQESDSEGQLITFQSRENRYRFFTDDLLTYREEELEIMPGEIYVSPSMISMFGAEIGDEITFPIVRGGKNMVFTIKGFYEDPFMGSSMIEMKGFLICETDRNEILSLLENAGIDALARDGAMIHIFTKADSEITIVELNTIINEKTLLPEYAEFVHSKEAIKGFMLILQNAFSGLLLAFVIVLLFVTIVAISHNIGSTIESDAVNMGILKTIGFTAGKLRGIQLIQYLFIIITGMFFGVFLAIPLSRLVIHATITTTGVRIPIRLWGLGCGVAFAVIIILFAIFVLWRTSKISTITPIKAIRKERNKFGISSERMISVLGKGLYFRLVFRQLMTRKQRYIGACIVAIFLVFFASLVGRMNSWLGADGKGMMDAFNPADHDIGVQVFGNLTTEEAEDMARSYSDITDTYLLAMQGVTVNGIDYTANVISEPERFHILEGRSCMADSEIVLTEFVAADLDIAIGDMVMIRGDKGIEEYVVSGIHSCANDMGDNVGMSREGYLKIGYDNSSIWCWHYFLSDPSKKEDIMEVLETAYGGDIHVHENSWSGLYGIIATMKALMIFMYGIVFVFILIITVMTGSKILSAEQKDFGIYKAIGFRSEKLRMIFALRFGMVAVIGAGIGVILAEIFTDLLVSTVMKFAGISNFMSVLSISNVLMSAGVVILLFMRFSYFASGKIEKLDMTILMEE